MIIESAEWPGIYIMTLAIKNLTCDVGPRKDIGHGYLIQFYWGHIAWGGGRGATLPSFYSNL